MVSAELFGPVGSAVLRLALDTGATTTLGNVGHLVAVGYDPSLTSDRVQVTTGSGMEFVPRIEVIRLKALGQERAGFPVLSHTLPASAGIDGRFPRSKTDRRFPPRRCMFGLTGAPSRLVSFSE